MTINRSIFRGASRAITLTFILAQGAICGAQQLGYDPGLFVITDYKAMAVSNILLGGVQLPSGLDQDHDFTQNPIGNPTDFSFIGQATHPLQAITAKRVCDAWPSFVHKRTMVFNNEWKVAATPDMIILEFVQQLEHVGGYSTTANLTNPTAALMDAAHETNNITTTPFEVVVLGHMDLWVSLMTLDANPLQSASGTWDLDARVYFDFNGNGEVDPFEPLAVSVATTFSGNTGQATNIASTAPTTPLDEGLYVLEVEFRAVTDSTLNGSVCGPISWGRSNSQLNVLAEVEARIR